MFPYWKYSEIWFEWQESQNVLLKETFKRSSGPTLCHGQGHLSSNRVAQSPSNVALSISNDKASTASLRNISQCLPTLIIKNAFLLSSLNCPSFSLTPLPHVLPLQEGWNLFYSSNACSLLCLSESERFPAMLLHFYSSWSWCANEQSSPQVQSGSTWVLKKPWQNKGRKTKGTKRIQTTPKPQNNPIPPLKTVTHKNMTL